MKGQFRINKDKQHPDRPYRVEGTVAGKRRRAFFATLEDAKEHARVENLQLRNLGHAAANITASLRLEALSCQQALAPYGVSLTEAVRVYLDHYQARAKSVTVQVAWDAYKAHSRERYESNEIGREHLEGTINTVSRFVESFGTEQLCDMSSDRIGVWLTELKRRDGEPMSSQSKKAYRLGVSGLFTYAIARKWISEHAVKPVRASRTRRDQARRPAVLSLEQVSALLQSADPKFLPAIAIGLFAGLRPAEVRRLRWEDIHWDKKQIDVLATSSKTASYRYVPMSDNLLEWLAPYRNLSGRLYDLNKHGLAHCLSAIGARAGITPWPKDCLRHSYGSHLYAATENAHLVARRMGHMTSDMLHSNYNNRRTREQGEAYFQIRPSGAKLEAKIVAIAA